MTTKERLALINSLTPEEAAVVYFDWEFWARAEQLPPDSVWRIWLILAGRGFGKTRSGAQWVKSRVESGRAKRVALVGATAADVRDVMVEGESGILACSPPWFYPTYEPSKRRLTWPNGAIATCYSGDTPGQLRGPQHDAAWADEPQKWRYGVEAWDNLEFGLRLGEDPRAVATCTPLPIKLIREIMADPMTAITRGSTYANKANLAPSFIRRVLKKYEGTRLGRQELHAEILNDTPGALWTHDLLERNRITKPPEFRRIVVAVDPNASSGEGSAETGIIAAALGVDGHGYVLDDDTLRGTPAEWARQAVATFNRHKANLMVAEVNNGGEMVVYTISTIDKLVPVKALHASRGKQARAEPISALYEQGLIHHVGMFADLETQLTSWVPATGAPSPDRMDALVWAFTELFLEPEIVSGIIVHDEAVSISPF